MTITDQNGNQVYSGTTNSQGMISAIPLVTSTESVAANGNDGAAHDRDDVEVRDPGYIGDQEGHAVAHHER